VDNLSRLGLLHYRKCAKIKKVKVHTENCTDKKDFSFLLCLWFWPKIAQRKEFSNKNKNVSFHTKKQIFDYFYQKQA
jgi:hypothetical protein